MKNTLCVVCFLAANIALAATDPSIGTWVLRSDSTDSRGDAVQATLTITSWGSSGKQLSYRFALPRVGVSSIVVQTPMDGTSAPVLVNGRAVGETIAIKRRDSRHATSVVKWNGTVVGTSKETISADGKTMTVVSDMNTDLPTAQAGTQTLVWVKQ